MDDSILIQGSNHNQVFDNTIGSASAPPGRNGIEINGGSIDAEIQFNTISYSKEDGIYIHDTGTAAGVFANLVTHSSLHGVAIYNGAGPVMVDDMDIWFSGGPGWPL